MKQILEMCLEKTWNVKESYTGDVIKGKEQRIAENLTECLGCADRSLQRGYLPG